MKKLLISNLLVFLFAIFISLPAIFPYFHKGYFPTHDGEWAVVRLADMFREVRDYQFPPRFSGYLNFGYGYPLFNFVYPMPYYLGLVVYFFNFGFVGSIKFLFSSSVILSAFFMFLASKELWKNEFAGVISAILYVYLPFRFVDLYVRGSLGDSLSFVLFAALFYAVIKLINKPSSRLFLVFGSISYAFLITTHNIMAVLFTLFLGIFLTGYMLVQKKKGVVIPILAVIVLGLGLSSFFWIPALLEKNNILLSSIPIADRNLYFTNFSKFILPKIGYGVPTDKNGFSYQLGIPHLIILMLSLFTIIFIFLRKKKDFSKESVKCGLILSLISVFFIFLLFPSSFFLWKLPLLSEINYPWLALAVIGFSVSLSAGFISSQFKKAKYILSLLAILAVIMFSPYAKPQYYVDREEGFYLTNDATTTSSQELMPLWVKKMPIRRAENKIEIIKGGGTISNLFYNSKKINFAIDAKEDTTLRMNTIYYPGWKAFSDGKELNIKYDNDYGIMDINVAEGKHMVEIKFGETLVRIFSDAISVVSVFILLSVLI